MVIEEKVGAVFRELSDREHEGVPVRVVGLSRVFRTDPADLWEALSDRERLARWFGTVDGELEPGGRYKIKGNAKGQITRCDPPHAFDLTWEVFFNVSWVEVRLEPVDGKTRLTLHHLMRKGGMGERHWSKYGPGATGVGWDISLMALDLHISDPNFYFDETAWTATAQARTFLQGCARDWGLADAAAGTAANEAEARALVTAAFYSGS